MLAGIFLMVPFEVTSAPLLVLDESTQVYNLTPYLEILEDRSASLDIDSVLRIQDDSFRSTDDISTNIGFTDGRIWTRFKIRNESNESIRRIVELANPRIQVVEFYILQDGKVLDQRLAGTSLPFQQREYEYRYPVFGIDFPPNTTQTIYLATKTETSHYLNILLRTEKNLTNTLARDYLLNGLLFGVLSFLLIFNFALVRTTGDTVFLAQVFYLATALMYTLGMLGFGYQFLWPDNIWWAHHSGNILGAMTIVLACNFGQRFLGTKQSSAISHLILNAVAYLAALYTLLAFILDYRTTQRGLLLLGMFYPVLLLGVSLIEWKSGNPVARFFVIAYSFLCVSLFAWVLRLAGQLPESIFISNILVIGLVSEFVLLTIAMLDRLNEQKGRQIQAVKERLDTSNAVLNVTNFSERFVPSRALQLLGIRNLGEANLGDQVEERMSILFVNIQGLVSKISVFENEQKLDFLNQYFKLVNPIVNEHNGFICRYIGDSMQCVFARSADDAVMAASNMLNELQLFAMGYADLLENTFQIDMGIHTGHMRLGIVGEPSRMEMQVLGDGVNLAARVQSVAHQYGVQLLISGETRRAMARPDDFPMRLIDVMQPRGRIESVAMYEVFCKDSMSLREKKLASLPVFEMAVMAKNDNRNEVAKKLFEEVLSICPEDAVAGVYLKRLKETHDSSVGTPSVVSET